MSPRQYPAQDQDTSKNDYPLHDLESQTHDLPPHQDISTIRERGEERGIKITKGTHEKEFKTTWTATISALSSKHTYFDKMPITLMRKTKGGGMFIIIIIIIIIALKLTFLCRRKGRGRSSRQRAKNGPRSTRGSSTSSKRERNGGISTSQKAKQESANC